MSHLAVLTFTTRDGAEEALRGVLTDRVSSPLGNALQIQDAAVVVKTERRQRVKVTQTVESIEKGGKIIRGSWWGLLIGLLFGGPIGGALLGGLIGKIAGRNVDLGIDNEFIRKVGDSLEPGGSALLVLTDKSPDEALAAAAEAVAAGLILTAISTETAKVLGEIAADDEIADAIQAESAADD